MQIILLFSIMEFQDKLLELSYCRQCKNKKNTIKLVVNKIICNFAQSPSFCEIVKQSCMIIFLFYIMNSTHVEFAKKNLKFYTIIIYYLEFLKSNSSSSILYMYTFCCF